MRTTFRELVLVLLSVAVFPVRAATTGTGTGTGTATGTAAGTATATATSADTDVADADTSDPNLTIVGTWSSKSNQVFTGPGFYDPVDELLIEPSLPGVSYSFTADGYFEEATYQVSGNPRDPSCPQAALTWQHGRYEVLKNGTLVLHPLTVDGRQLVSDPCTDKGTSTYTRYNQTETFKSYLVFIDPYHGIYTLQLYQFDGSPMQPLYLAYRPPMMLPTQTLNPTSSGANVQESQAPSQAKRSLQQNVKRSLENKYRTNAELRPTAGIAWDLVWYSSAAVLGLGSVLFLVY
ncbi:Rot1p KNAG_0I02390 [Huiozyma naganishii CBS 8797]|uniref:Protein ROT1 n=1 Tax=Huiozyma naganishii (strain ATCC MYA-139 / BCRC 22969 / CBS 8797 / KCTC 17520 / NBRC 10181 / NCYC 3082 / Yp74L-3) TaxID=1071383 RepID=J7RAY4_HUIN7|nr:hypothetical protein KNAG_0I02390 [Kazachstania naganishii CBS 8797]CCK72025.1 hypothetical protein KNAG_0I02390 [Kazachstania naganishii CBS 8797]